MAVATLELSHAVRLSHGRCHTWQLSVRWQCSHGSCHMASVCLMATICHLAIVCYMAIVYYAAIVCHMAFVCHACTYLLSTVCMSKGIQPLQSLTRQECTCATALAAKPCMYADATVPGQCVLSKKSGSCRDVSCCCRSVPPASILQPTHLRTQMDTPGFLSMPLLVKGK